MKSVCFQSEQRKQNESGNPYHVRGLVGIDDVDASLGVP